MYPSLTSNVLKRIIAINDYTVSNGFLQSVRWHRKPRWVPIAKSKMFRIPVRPVIPEEEHNELVRLHRNYKTQMRAVRHFLHCEVEAEELSLQNTSSEESKRGEALDFDKCFAENELWNAEVSLLRDERLKAQADVRTNQILNTRKMREEKMAMKLEAAKEIVRTIAEESKSFIIRDKIDEAIEHSLSNQVDFNYAIDLAGRIYPGRDTDITAATSDNTMRYT